MQPTNVTTQYKPGKQHHTGNAVTNTTDPSSGRKIPSIINIYVNRSQNKHSSKDIVTQPCAGIQGLKSNKHAVKIIGDSHLRDSVMINQYLPSKYEATGFIKPGATSKKIVTEWSPRYSCFSIQIQNCCDW
jgi:hypothetical protein